MSVAGRRVRSGGFREDLYYRLQGLVIPLPPQHIPKLLISREAAIKQGVVCLPFPSPVGSLGRGLLFWDFACVFHRNRFFFGSLPLSKISFSLCLS